MRDWHGAMRLKRGLVDMGYGREIITPFGRRHRILPELVESMWEEDLEWVHECNRMPYLHSVTIRRFPESDIGRIFRESQEENEKKWGRPNVKQFTLSGIDLMPMLTDMSELFHERKMWCLLEQMQEMYGAECFEGMRGGRDHGQSHAGKSTRSRRKPRVAQEPSER